MIISLFHIVINKNMTKTEQKLIISKSNDLIENYIFNSTELELQILNYAVSKLNTLEDNKNIVSTLYIKDITETFKTKSNRAYEHYKNALLRLMKREYTYFDKIKNKFVTENLIIRIEIDPDDDTYFVFKFNEHISTKLSNLRTLFTSYDIKHISMFKSRYAFMLYEFFKMKISQSENNIYHQKISIEDFKENLGIADKYKLFTNLKLRVIDTAKTNINNHSDLSLNYKEISLGKKVTHIKFTVKYKTKNKANGEELEPIKTKKIAEHQEELKFETIDPRASKDEAKKHLDEMKKHFNVKKIDKKEEIKKGFFQKLFK
jgi:plasmid replication initiation protein